MTIKQLIEELSTFNPNAEISIRPNPSYTAQRKLIAGYIWNAKDLKDDTKESKLTTTHVEIFIDN